MDLFKIKLLQAWKDSKGVTFNIGDILDVDKATKGKLIEVGIAIEYDEAAEKAEKEATEKAQKEEKEQAEKLSGLVMAAVTRAFEALASAKDSKGKSPLSMVVTQSEEEKQAGQFKTLGDQLQAIAAVEQTKQIHPGLVAIEKIASSSGLNEAVGSEGEFLVRADFTEEIMQKAFETGVLASKTTRVPISAASNRLIWNSVDETSRVAGSRRGGVQVFRRHEAATKTSSQPKWKQSELNLEKMTALYFATDELLQDTTALTSMVSKFVSEEFGFKMDDEIYRGSGTGEILGLLNADATVQVDKEDSQTADTIVVQNIVNIFSRLFAPSMTNATWYINQDILPQLFLMTLAVGTGGAPVYLPAGNIAEAPFGMLLGRPVQPIEQASTLGDRGDIMLADLSEFILIEKGGIEAAQSIHVKFLEDETAFRFVMRNNGQPLWDVALTPAQGTKTQSPFIVLEERT